MRFDLVIAASFVSLIGAACGSDRPAENVITIDTVVAGFAGDDVVVAFDAAARGEWWTCDLRLTSDACIDGFHPAVFLGLPVYDDIDELGGNRCVDELGPSGVFEIMQAADNLLTIPADLSGFVVVAADADDDGILDTAREGELHGSARIVSGTVELFFVGTFEQELVLRLTGVTDGGDDIAVDFYGPMQAFGNPPPLQPSSTCE